MKSKVKLLLVALLSVGIAEVHAQTKKAPNADPPPVQGPGNEGGGTPSTSWLVNANGLHVNGYSNIGIGTVLPTRKLDILGAANTMIRVSSTGGGGTHVSGIEFKRSAVQHVDNWDIVNQGQFRFRKEGIAVVSLDSASAYYGSIAAKLDLNIWGKEIVPGNGVPESGTIVIRNKVSNVNQVLRLDANQLETDANFSINHYSDKHVDLVRGGGRVRINTEDTQSQLNIGSTSHMQLCLVNHGTQGASWNIGVSNKDWVAGGGKLVFSKDAGSGNAAMVITPDNYVGIGLSNPSKPLQVNGVTSTKILEITGGADFAETFDVAENNLLQPGTVVSIDPENPGQLRVSTAAYDKTVAGIISGAGGIQPGMLMGQEGTIANGKHPVALTGRVYCLVDATYGSIQAGDLLTTSPTAGHAMKATDDKEGRGAIIGKAMTSLKEGKALVLVLVSLQ